MEQQTFFGVLPPGEAAGTYWPQIAALIETSLQYGRGEYELEDIRTALIREQVLAIASLEGDRVKFVVTCSVNETPRKRVLYIEYGAGCEGAELKDAVVRVAKTLHCDWVETRCRAAVARLYRKAGFDINYYTPILEIHHDD